MQFSLYFGCLSKKPIRLWEKIEIFSVKRRSHLKCVYGIISIKDHQKMLFPTQRKQNY